MTGARFYDGVTLPILAALRERPQSAMDLSAILGQGADRRNARALFSVLEQLERRAEVQRSRTGSGPWIWDVPRPGVS